MKSKPAWKVLSTLLMLTLACGFLPALTLGSAAQMGDLPTRYPSAFFESRDGSAGEIKPRALMEGYLPFFEFAPDGKHYLIGSQPGPLRFCETVTGKELWRLRAPAYASIRNAGFSPDGTLIAVTAPRMGEITALDEPIWLLEGSTGKIIKSLEGAACYPGAIRFSPDGRSIMAWSLSAKRQQQSNASSIVLWDVETGRVRSAKQISANQNESYASYLFSNDGNYTVLGITEMVKVRLPDMALFKELYELWETTGLTFAGALAPKTENQPVLPSGSHHGIANGGFRVRNPVREKIFLTPLALRYFAKLSANGKLVVWDYVANKELVHLDVSTFRGESSNTFESILSRNSGTLMVREHYRGQILLFDISELLRDAGNRPPACSDEFLENQWADLASPHQDRSFDAFCTLFARPKQTCDLLTMRLLPAPAPFENVPATWLADLDHPQYRVREKTTHQLQQLDPSSLPILRETRAAPKTTLEQKRRLDIAIASLEKRAALIAAQEQRDVLGIELLEQINTPAAKDVLTKIAQDEAYGWRAAEAKASLARMK